MKKYSTCTSETMKKDISELCSMCPLKEEIIYLLETNLKEAKEKKEIIGDKMFMEFVNKEIRICTRKIDEILAIEFKSNKCSLRWARTKNYILYKGWILGLRKLSEEKKVINNEKRPNRTDIAYYCYYANETKTLDIEEVFPSDLAWEKIGGKFKKNSKNIQQAYNSIFGSKEERLKKTKKKNIEYVIDYMLTDKPKAKKLAEAELKILLQNS